LFSPLLFLDRAGLAKKFLEKSQRFFHYPGKMNQAVEGLALNNEKKPFAKLKTLKKKT